MNECMTNASALLFGARCAPVGIAFGIDDCASSTFGTKRAGNSVAPMLPPESNVTK